MPDLITHVAVAHLLRRPLDLVKSHASLGDFRILFYLGTILPDILSRPWYILFPPVGVWLMVFHTPAGMIITCLIIALLFEKGLRKTAYALLLSGSFLHFFLDHMQKHVTGGYYWLFPFSWKKIGQGYFWAEDILPYIPLWLAMVLILEGSILFVKWVKKRRI